MGTESYPTLPRGANLTKAHNKDSAPCSDQDINRIERDLEGLLTGLLAGPLRDQRTDILKDVGEKIGQARTSIIEKLPVDYAYERSITKLGEDISTISQELERAKESIISELLKECATRKAQEELHDTVKQQDAIISRLAPTLAPLPEQINDLRAKTEAIQVLTIQTRSELERSLKSAVVRLNTLMLLTGLNFAALLGIVWFVVRH